MDRDMETAREIAASIRPATSSKRPTIAELEAILHSPDDKYSIQILPDGSIEARDDDALINLIASALRAARAEEREKMAAECSHKAFLCHTHDDFGKGREQGMLDCAAALRARRGE